MSSGEGPGIEGSGTTRRPIFNPSAASASVSKDELKRLRMRTEFLKGLQASKPGSSPLALTTILGYLSSLALYLKHTVMRPLDEALQADVSSVSSIQESSADDHSVFATDEQLPLYSPLSHPLVSHSSLLRPSSQTMRIITIQWGYYPTAMLTKKWIHETTHLALLAQLWISKHDPKSPTTNLSVATVMQRIDPSMLRPSHLSLPSLVHSTRCVAASRPSEPGSSHLHDSWSHLLSAFSRLSQRPPNLSTLHPRP